MTGHGEKLTRKQEQAIAALMAAPSIVEAARQAGVSESTLLRWLQTPDFDAYYRAARREVVKQATGKLSAASGEAVDILRAVMTDQTAPASSRVTAARAILDYAYKALELDDLATRILILEERTARDDASRELG